MTTTASNPRNASTAKFEGWAGQDILESLASLDAASLIGRLRYGIEHFDPRVFEMDHDLLDRWFGGEQLGGEQTGGEQLGEEARPSALGTWSCRALLAHLMDADLVYTHRIRRVLAEDAPVLQNWDEQAFLDSPLAGLPLPGRERLLTPPGAMAAAIHTIRQMQGATLYQLADADWSRRGLHPLLGEVTLRELVEIMVWHLEHHTRFLNAKITHLLGPAPAACAEGSQAGGCGSGCACVADPESA